MFTKTNNSNNNNNMNSKWYLALPYDIVDVLSSAISYLSTFFNIFISSSMSFQFLVGLLSLYCYSRVFLGDYYYYY